MHERELVERCRRRERDAQRELYERTANRIYALLLKLTGNAEDAVELTQDTYLRAFSRIDQFDGKAAISTWLYRIAVNEGLRFLRNARIAERNEERSARQHAATAQIDFADARFDVAAALTELPPTDRALLLLRYHEGLDYQTIAQVSELAAGTIASRLNRARQKLRDLLLGYESREETDRVAYPILRPRLGTPQAVASEALHSRQTGSNQT